jgi:hypothetical protein
MLAWVVWRRWSWRAGLPVLAGALLLIGWLIESSRPPHLPRTFFVVVLTRSILMIPFAMYIAWVFRALVRGDWRTLGWTLVGTAVLAMLGGAAWFAIDRRTLLPGEFYVWSGWQSTFLTGAYLTGLLAGLWWVYGLARGQLAGGREPQASPPAPRTASP